MVKKISPKGNEGKKRKELVSEDEEEHESFHLNHEFS